MIFILKLRFYERRLSSEIINLALPLIFLKFASMKSLKMFTIFEICPADHLKAKKIGVAEAVSSPFAILCFVPLSQIWSYEFFINWN